MNLMDRSFLAIRLVLQCRLPRQRGARGDGAMTAGRVDGHPDPAEYPSALRGLVKFAKLSVPDMALRPNMIPANH